MNRKKKKTQIDIIYININVLNVKRKRIEKALFNVFASEKNDYFNVNIMYIFKKKRLFLCSYNISQRIERLNSFEYYFK